MFWLYFYLFGFIVAWLSFVVYIRIFEPNVSSLFGTIYNGFMLGFLSWVFVVIFFSLCLISLIHSTIIWIANKTRRNDLMDIDY